MGVVDRAAVHTLEAGLRAGDAWGLMRRAQSIDDPLTRSEIHALAMDAALDAYHAAQEALGILEDLGARVDNAEPARARAVPLHLLDTPDTRALLVGMRQLLPIAERIDAARGRSKPEVHHGAAGVDLARDLAQTIARLELEVNGPHVDR